MIEVQHLSKSFRQKGEVITAVNDVSLSIQEGEIYGIIGLSGAGKSTLVRLLNRLEEPDAGAVIIEGVDLAKLSKKELSKLRGSIGMIFQSFNLFPSRTVLENILFPLKKLKLPKDQAYRRAEELLKLCGLEDKMHAYPEALSGGQKQRTGIARALASKPRMLLCDEATSALDPQTTEQILELLRTINRELKVTVVLITHEMAVVKAICDRVAVMEDGRLIEEGPVYKIFSEPTEEVTKNFIQSTSNRLKLDRLLQENSSLIDLKEDEVMMQLTFIEDSAGEAVISDLSRAYDIRVNILFADLDVLQNCPLGSMVAVFQGPRKALNQAALKLIEKNIRLEVIRDGRRAE